jgi:ADP-ribosylglycohydrolase
MRGNQRSTDRVLGCLIGGAIGDAVGGPFEGSGASAHLPPLQPGFISDDTQLTLATCEAIVARQAVDPAAIAEQYVLWHRHRKLTGLGASTAKAIVELAAGGHWALVGHKGEMSAGSGAAMRIAPLAFCLEPGDRDSRRMLRDVSRITHRNDEAYIGALAVAIAVRAAWNGSWSGDADLLERVASDIPDSRVRDRCREVASTGMSDVHEVAARFGCSGYVVDAVPVALFAAQRVRRVGFEESIGDVVSAGGDTDTIASITGQIAGTLLGVAELPQPLIDQLLEREMILGIAHEFAGVVMQSG